MMHFCCCFAVDLGLLKVEASTLMADSTPVSAAVGRDVVRCVTKPLPDSWFLFDFGEAMTIAATHYAVRHYSSWDAEAIRNWRFEASTEPAAKATAGPQYWTTLSEHVNDVSLDRKGAVHTWMLPAGASQRAYRTFRIRQTGENSNKHLYLAVSGFEIYGLVYRADGRTPFPLTVANCNLAAAANLAAANASVASVSSPSGAALSSNGSGGNSLEFRYTSDFDGNGIVHYLGTQYGTQSWRNPDTAGLMNVTASSVAPDSQPLSCAVGNAVVRCVTKPEPDSWICFDFGNALIRPTAYTLRLVLPSLLV